MSESVLNFLEEKNLPEVTKKKHTYLMMDGHDQEDIYVLKDGVVKVSIVVSYQIEQKRLTVRN